MCSSLQSTADKAVRIQLLLPEYFTEYLMEHSTYTGNRYRINYKVGQNKRTIASLPIQ